MTEHCTDTSTASLEETNYYRYHKLLMHVGREVLMTLFKESYCKEEGRQWEQSCGPSFLNSKFTDRQSQSYLGKPGVDSIRSGNCDAWDITLLSSLLLVKPG